MRISGAFDFPRQVIDTGVFIMCLSALQGPCFFTYGSVSLCAEHFTDSTYLTVPLKFTNLEPLLETLS